jgi:outer membrane protein OmpA-like peptidoglycan-associated protein
MRQARFAARAALGLVLATAPLAAGAQTAAPRPVAIAAPEPQAGTAPAADAALAPPAMVPAEPGGAGVYPQALSALQQSQRGIAPADQDPRPVAVIDGVVPASDLRRSADAFSVTDRAAGTGDGGSELDRAGLGSLARLAVGMPLGEDRVIARTGERVVVQRDGADPVLWRDDDATLRDAQSPRWIEVYDDGSTLTRWQRADGSWTVSIRDATGRALWRERILPDGVSVVLIDDLTPGAPVDLSDLPADPSGDLGLATGGDPALTLALLAQAEAGARAQGRSYTLRQMRETRALRDLVPGLGPVDIAFGVNAASVGALEGAGLAAVGGLIAQLIAAYPRELFLIEGHTDGTGAAAHNLILSDRRAESVALALIEGFAIPPENLIVQGYGPQHPRVPGAGAEAGNRRVAIRRITPLMHP